MLHGNKLYISYIKKFTGKTKADEVMHMPVFILSYSMVIQPIKACVVLYFIKRNERWPGCTVYWGKT